jgi:hypothetical protein
MYLSPYWVKCSSALVSASFVGIGGKISGDRIFSPFRYTSM